MTVSTARSSSRSSAQKPKAKRVRRPPQSGRTTRPTKRKPPAAAQRVAKVSRTRKPDEMSLEDWQIALRRQFGREQNFDLVNTGEHPFFSTFQVTNRQSKNTYRVAIRGAGLGENFCSCPDFATNHLGTCKHVEFTLARLERRRGAKRAFSGRFQPPYSEVFLRYGAQRQIVFRAGTECPGELARLAAGYFDDEGGLLPDALARFPEFLEQAAAIEHELRCYDDALRFIAGVRDDAHRRQRIVEAFPDGVRSSAFEGLLKVSLYDYQREGALFAARAGRCLIGDEMGLGKTVQAIAAAEIMARELGVERVLIICPTSLKHQWEREIARFTDRTATVIAGPRHQRAAQFRDDSFFKITNYDTVHRDLEYIEELRPELVILDEAQRIKNWETRAARSVKRIDSPYAIVLTGTPLENRLEELVSIVQFIDQHRLGPTYRLLHDHQMRDETGRVVGYRDLDRIGRTLEPILLRRQKDQVLDQLPERLEKTFFVPMTEPQWKYHQENADTVARIVRKWRTRGFLTESEQRILMVALQNMRMSCDSTYLLDHQTDHSTKPDELATLLDELLERPTTKAVIFSQWTRMHEVSLRRFERRGWDHVLFHGGVEGRKRKDLVDRFREDANCRAFFSTDAGGVGLNLQHANVVVNLDLPWNPAVLEQRIGRAHRLGQTQPVQVVNFVAQGTIEEGMLSVLAFKKSLFAGVLDGGEKEIFLGGSRLTKFMETVENVTGHIPESRPEPAGVNGDGLAEDDDVERRQPRRRGKRRSDEPDERAESPRATAAADPLAGLLQQGLMFLEQLAASARPSATAGARPRPSASAAGGPLVETVRDEASGRSYLKLPMPEPETLDRVLHAIGSLLEAVRR
ncbi:MAG TPA: DEAD/DEAH box helicase [Planctomycetaceae bacterium]|nr:DEAD/DEAH box helicase [Planctomycetaceae bacterium]